MEAIAEKTREEEFEATEREEIEEIEEIAGEVEEPSDLEAVVYEALEAERARRCTWWQDYEEPEKPLAQFSAKEIGMEGECLAARHLHHHDFEILEQNWRTKCGEVDIIARDPSGEVVLVEVKTRLKLGADKHAMPELAVDARKQLTYRKLALIYLVCHPEVESLRFDVMAVNIVGEHTARLRHLVGAFEWDA